MIKLILTDIDGVWTDGSMYYDNEGNELKKFSTYDGVGVKLAHDNNLKVGIITGEQTKIAENRAKKLKVDMVYQGVDDKLSVLDSICQHHNYSYDDIAYIGDDINDLPLLEKLLSASPSSAFSEKVKSTASFVTKHKGGEGAFREFVEIVIDHNNASDSN
jgi:3-deoxy-D-glycero-D-galacto-nononate 9-phosphatase